MGKQKTPDERLAIIKEYYDSGTTNVANFCKEHDLARATFYDWLKVYNLENGIIRKSSFFNVTESVKGNLIESQGVIENKEIIPVEAPKASNIIKMKHPNGVEFEFDVEILSLVVKEIL